MCGRSSFRSNDLSGNTTFSKAHIFHVKMHNPYIDYYLNQQGHGGDMAVLRGAPWQMGHGQMGYGLGAVFRSLTKVASPILKRGAKTLGQIAMSTCKDLLGDLVQGKNVKGAAKAPGKERTSWYCKEQSTRICATKGRKISNRSRT